MPGNLAVARADPSGYARDHEAPPREGGRHPEARPMNAPTTVDDEVLYALDGHVAVITLNRPERMNTISGAMLGQLTKHLLAADADPEVRVVILTGTGRAFCAGLDLTEATGQTQGGISNSGGLGVTLDLRNTPPTVLYNMDTPVICALNGSAAGYGMDTALGCDIRIMAESAKMAAAFTKRGVVPESGGTWFLPRLLGWSKAAELIFTGRTLTAAQSVEMGLASEVVPDDQVMVRAREIAAEIASCAPLAVQASKRMMRMGMNETFNDHVHHVFLQLMPLFRSQDAGEGMRAFMEKRPAVFKGR
jgi:enoyl-CoA hydratase/carnithine racemase